MRTVYFTRIFCDRQTGEWIVRAYGQDKRRIPSADYYTDTKLDAQETAVAMTGGISSPLPKNGE